MIIYAVFSTYYDNKKPQAYMRQLELDRIPENKVSCHKNYDSYADYYTSKKEAEKAVDDVRRA